ncbi:MAG: hypothetical protein WDZ41_01945 [Candidatus Babeliales bacterium]
MKVDVTVGIPLYNMGQIATLALEGLCKQKTTCKWELIVCEEQTENMLSQKVLETYEKRLKKAGCVKIIYAPLKEWIPLAKKWTLIAENSSDSKCFILQAGDCLPHSKRIQQSFNKINKGYDYYDENRGYWYSFRLDKTILWKPNERYYLHPCRLNMAWKTELFKQLPLSNVKKNVDGFIYNSLLKIKKDLKKYTNNTLYIDGVDTDGYNCISSRDRFFKTVPNMLFQDPKLDVCTLIPILNDYKNKQLNTRIKDIVA